MRLTSTYFKQKLSITERIKWPIARLLNRLLPNSCWADLCTWSSGFTAWADVDKTDGKCKTTPFFDADCGGCWCGKFRICDNAKGKKA